MGSNGKFFVMGLDLGQAQDYTSVGILQLVTEGRKVDYHCRHLERFALRTPYPAIVAQVQERITGPDLRGRTALVVDATGVGAPIVDMVRAGGLSCVAVTIHGGEAVVTVPGGYRVPKRDLVSTVQVLLQTQRLLFAAGMPLVDTLVTELTNFRYKITATAHDVYGVWREGGHDDLVLAVALAVWYAECAPVVVTRTRYTPVRVGAW